MAQDENFEFNLPPQFEKMTENVRFLKKRRLFNE